MNEWGASTVLLSHSCNHVSVTNFSWPVAKTGTKAMLYYNKGTMDRNCQRRTTSATMDKKSLWHSICLRTLAVRNTNSCMIIPSKIWSRDLFVIPIHSLNFVLFRYGMRNLTFINFRKVKEIAFSMSTLYRQQIRKYKYVRHDLTLNLN